MSRQSRCAPRTRRPQTARTPPTPRRPPPAPAVVGRTRHSVPHPPQRKGPRRSMPRAPSPGRPRQGRRCAHARGGRPPARAAGRPRAYGRGPRSSWELAVDAAAADGPDRPIRRRAGGSAAPLYRSRQTLPRRPTCSAVPCARACRCTQTTTRLPPAHPPRPAPSPPGQLSRRSCAFGATSPRASPTASTNSPAIAAAGSAWPAFALTLPTASGACASPRACSSAACSEPASIGSPSAVPVPCASSRATSAATTPASASDACSSAHCAMPLGAVRLALLPSCRIALPRTTADSA
eukprot:scaffold40865_cov63-Phaeocystis_antarctica.AAC.2